MHRLPLYLSILAFSATALCAHIAYADFVVTQNLSFGEFIIQDNNTRHSVTINADGTYAHSPTFIEITSPKQGIYQVDELEPNTIINVTASQIQPMTGSGNFFTLGNFQITHTNVDQAGLATINLGASALTSGNGLRYVDDNYSGQIQIQISF